jgi:Protein of unknown function (DUF3800)
MSVPGFLPAALSRRGYFLMLHLFLDDSGKESHQTNPWVCMAGYLADYETVNQLNGKWMQLLIKHGIGEIHMKQLIPISGQYKELGWDVPKRDAVVGEFIQAINETRMWGLGVAVEVEAWRKQKKKHPQLSWGTVQQFCLERLLRRTVDQLHAAGIDDTVALVFDTDPEFGPNRFNLFCALMGHDERAARRLSSITFGHPVYYPGLQCADLLVWETRKELMQKHNGYQSTKRWQAMFTQMPDYHLDYIAGERWGDASFEDAMPQIIANLPSSGASSTDPVATDE